MLAERSCIVVGAGPGLGMAVARRFAVEGLAVAAISRSAPDTRTLGPGHIGLAADASDPADLRRAIGQARDRLPPVAALVHNAAIYPPAVPTQLDPNDLAAAFAVNVTAALVATQAVLADLRQAGGTVLLTGGGAALHPVAPYAALATTKAALRALAFALHDDLRPVGIQATTITITGSIGSTPRLAPDRIAEHYWNVHTRRQPDWRPEDSYPD